MPTTRFPPSTPTHCVCGSSFTVQHVLSCPRGGFPIIRHNELRDLTAHLLTEVCHDVKTEPDLQLLTGETLSHTSANSSDGATLDIAVNVFFLGGGGRFERTYLDVRVFNPLAASNSNTDISKCYRKHENEKKRVYEQQIAMLAEKWDQSHRSTLNWLRCSISFALLRSAI